MSELEKILNLYSDFMVIKTGCPYCIKAQNLKPEIKIIDCTENSILVNEIQKKFNYKTYPMIFINKTFIGGYTDLLEYYK